MCSFCKLYKQLKKEEKASYHYIIMNVKVLWKPYQILNFKDRHIFCVPTVYAVVVWWFCILGTERDRVPYCLTAMIFFS